MFHRNNHGFGIVEVLVAFVLFGVLIVAMISQMTFATRATKSVGQSAEITQMMNLVSMALSGTACKDALRDAANNPITINTRAAPGAVVTTVDQILVNGNSILRAGMVYNSVQVQIMNMRMVSDLDSPAAQTNFLMNLVITPIKTGSPVGGQPMPKIIPIRVTATNPGSTASAIDSCGVSGGPSDSVPVGSHCDWWPQNRTPKIPCVLGGVSYNPQSSCPPDYISEAMADRYSGHSSRYNRIYVCVKRN